MAEKGSNEAGMVENLSAEGDGHEEVVTIAQIAGYIHQNSEVPGWGELSDIRETIQSLAGRVVPKQLDLFVKSGQFEQNIRGVLDLTVEGVSLVDKVVPVVEFFIERAMSHKSAIAEITNRCPSVVDGDGFDYQAVLSSIDASHFYSSLEPEVDEGESSQLLKQSLRRGIYNEWRQSRDILTRPDLQHVASYCTNLDLALNCPRVLSGVEGLKALGTWGVTNFDAVEALRYQTMFCLASHRAFKMPPKKGQGYHRQAYMLAQIAAVIGGEVGAYAEIPPRNVSLPAPSLALDLDDCTKEEMRSFIDARISLLLPDRGVNLILTAAGDSARRVVQESMVSSDIIALSKKVGLYDEYKAIFDALFYLRQVQFFETFHFHPETPDTRRWSLADVFKNYFERNSKLPAVGSFGSGKNCLMEQEIMRRGWAEYARAVDKDDGTTGDTEAAFSGGGVDFKSYGIKGMNLEDKKIADELREKVLNNLGGSDVIVAADSLHETDHPRQYLADLYLKALNDGGYLYVSDPIHCVAVDGVTQITLNHFDNTRHPSSMLSLEDYLEVIWYLKIKGAIVESISVVPSPFAGYGDEYWRLNFTLHKPISGTTLDYEIPGESIEKSKDVLTSDEQIFKIWPFSLINEDERGVLLQVIGKEKWKDKGVALRDVRAWVIRELTLADEFQEIKGDLKRVLQRRRKKHEPFPSANDLLKKVGLKDPRMVCRNRAAAQAMLLTNLFEGNEDLMTVDLRGLIRKNTPGWKFFL